MDTIKFWSVFVIGVAAGAGVALICAPQSGKETRKQIKGKFDDASDYVKDAAGDLSDKAGKVYSKGKSIASDYVSKGKDAAGEYIDDLSSAAHDVADRVKASV